VGPQYGEIISNFVLNVSVNVLSAQENAQLGQPDYFGFGPRNVKNDPVSVCVSKCPVRPMWSIVLHDNGSTTTRRMTSRFSRK